jgi:hypothetical protein
MFALPALRVLALLLLAPTLSVALDNSHLAQVFGADATDLTGASVKLRQFTFSVVTNACQSLVAVLGEAIRGPASWYLSLISLRR